MIQIKKLMTSLNNLRRDVSEALYIPCQTGSHSMGEQYMGDYASTYVENNNFPDSARAPFKGIQIHRNASASN
jgi:hypothetical protein